MYRNTYLQMYKTASANDSNITFMFAHFSQIYTTLGCVLQDLEFQIGKMLVQEAQLQQPKQPYQQYHKSREKARDKEVIKIEESLEEKTDQKSKGINQYENRVTQVKPRNVQPCKKEGIVSVQSSDDWLFARVQQIQKQIESKDCLKQKLHQKSVQISRKAIPSNSVNSFDYLFDKKGKSQKNKEQKQPQNSHLGQKAQPPENARQPNIENTYEDFLDRFFKQDKSRRSS